MKLNDKKQKLDELLKEMAPVVVAFSGGVDSSYLAFEAHEVLGSRAIAVLAESASVPSHQSDMAEQVMQRIGMEYRRIRSHELDIEAYRANPANRCYYCKRELFTRLQDIAREFESATIVDGLNADDLGDFRPGRIAGEELHIRSPLMEAGLTKDEIRELSRRAGLPTADQPASACLASRFPYGVSITEEKLRVVDAGEEYLRELGFRVFRVRHHDNLVRLEFGPGDLEKALDPGMARKLAARFKELGYAFVTLDLEGYRTGSSNEVLEPDEKESFTV